MTRHLDRPGTGGKSVPLIPLQAAADQYRTEDGARKMPASGSGKTRTDRSGTVSHRRHSEPVWNDANLRELAGHVSSPLFFAHIRAGIGSAVQQTNCHPFRHGRWLWMHNGFIDGFATVKRDLVLAVDESLYPEIKGQADTEVLFYLALSFGLEDDPPAAVARHRAGGGLRAGAGLTWRSHRPFGAFEAALGPLESLTSASAEAYPAWVWLAHPVRCFAWSMPPRDRVHQQGGAVMPGGVARGAVRAAFSEFARTVADAARVLGERTGRPGCHAG